MKPLLALPPKTKGDKEQEENSNENPADFGDQKVSSIAFAGDASHPDVQEQHAPNLLENPAEHNPLNAQLFISPAVHPKVLSLSKERSFHAHLRIYLQGL